MKTWQRSSLIIYLSATFCYNGATISWVLRQGQENPVIDKRENCWHQYHYHSNNCLTQKKFQFDVTFEMTLLWIIFVYTLLTFLWSALLVWSCQPWPWQQERMWLRLSRAFSLSAQWSLSCPAKPVYRVMHVIDKPLFSFSFFLFPFLSCSSISSKWMPLGAGYFFCFFPG